MFETVLEKAARLRDIYSGILWVYDGTRFHPAALHAVPPAYSDYIENPAEEAPVFADLRRGKDVVHVPDLAASCAENKLRRAVVDLRRSRTGLNIAIRKNEELLGVIVVGREQARPFSDAMFEKAMRLCDAAFGTLRRYDGERLDTESFRARGFAREPCAMLTPPEPEQRKPEYVTLQAAFDLASGERSIHDGNFVEWSRK